MCIKAIANEDLLQRTELCLMPCDDLSGKEIGKGEDPHICLPVADSLCCTAEMTTS